MKMTRKLTISALAGCAAVLATAAPAFADTITFSPASVTKGATVTINVKCDQEQGGTILGHGAFADIVVGAPPDEKPSYTATVTGAPGTYVVELLCFDSFPGPDGSKTPQTLVVTAAPPTPTPTPSGAPKAGGGGESGGSGTGMMAGALSILAAAGIGAAILRRRQIG